MLQTRKASLEELAEELRRRDDEPSVDDLGPIDRWRRNRMSRKLGRSDLTAVLRAYYGNGSPRRS
jgi:hypothetical protein